MLVSDKREESKRLEEAGMVRPLSETTVEMTISVIDKHAATKSDLENLATKTDVAETRDEIAAARDEFRKGISKTNERIDAVRDEFRKSASETDKSITRVEAKIDADTAKVIKWVVGTMISAAAVAVAVGVAVVTLLLKFVGG